MLETYMLYISPQNKAATVGTQPQIEGRLGLQVKLKWSRYKRLKGLQIGQQGEPEQRKKEVRI